MRWPRLNSLTGLNWSRFVRHKEEDPAEQKKHECLIRDRLESTGMFSAGKIGTSELMVLEYFDRRIRLPWPESASWLRPAKRLFENSGFFPLRKDLLENWRQLYVESLQALDVVAAWQPIGTYLSAYENRALYRYLPSAKRVSLSALHPVHPPALWLSALCKLRWLVISPFEKTILSQLDRLENLGVFSPDAMANLLQTRHSCRIIRCPQFSYLEQPRHPDWFATLEDLKSQMDSLSFDIVLVGAGAWSIPLIAHARKRAKKGLHLGGQLQLLFGIKGGRWDDTNIYNPFWIRPLPEERPENFMRMEKGAYW